MACRLIRFYALPWGWSDYDGSWTPGAYWVEAGGSDAIFWSTNALYSLVFRNGSVVQYWGELAGGNWQGPMHNRASVRCVKE